MSLDPDIERAAVTLLAARDHSRQELRRKLDIRGFASADIDAVLDDLTERSLLDEARMAEAYVDERSRKGFGPVRIRHELRQKGLESDQIERHLVSDTDHLLDLIKTAHDRKYGEELPADPRERARRGRFLEYRGFPGDLIRRFLDCSPE